MASDQKVLCQLKSIAKNLRSFTTFDVSVLPQISKGYDSYLDERGRGKAKKLANIAIYRLFE